MSRTHIIPSVVGAFALLLGYRAIAQPGNSDGLNAGSVPDAAELTFVRGGGGGGGGFGGGGLGGGLAGGVGAHAGGFGGGHSSFSAGSFGASPMARSTMAPRFGARTAPNAYNQLYLLGRTPAQQQGAVTPAPAPPTPAPNNRGRSMQSLPSPEAREHTPFYNLTAGGGKRRRHQSASMSACLKDWDPSTQMSRQEWAATCRRVGSFQP
jgi:hypothetical protein